MRLVEPIEYATATLADQSGEPDVGTLFSFRHDVGDKRRRRIVDAVTLLLL